MPTLFDKTFIKKSRKKEKVSIKDKVLGNLKKIQLFITDGLKDSKGLIGEIRSKFLNLSETNYNVGIEHFNKGNIWDATFRFKFIDKRWPNFKDEKYYLAYCYALNEKYIEAKNTLVDFLKDNTADSRAKKLLKLLENNDIEALANDYEGIVRDTLLGTGKQ